MTSQRVGYYSWRVYNHANTTDITAISSQIIHLNSILFESQNKAKVDSTLLLRKAITRRLTEGKSEYRITHY